MNTVAPGKRLFDSRKKLDFCDSSVTTTEKVDNKSLVSSSRDSNAEEKKEDDHCPLGVNKRSNEQRRKAVEVTPPNEVDSVLGKLAQVVLNEYSNGEEELHIFK